jgi:predicted MFS family arabinose efflux permease
LLGLIRERNFVLFMTSGTVSQLGDWALFLALPFYVYERTGSVFATGVLVAVQLMPRVLLSSAAGVLVDRWDRRTTMIGADLFRALLLLALLVPAAGGPLWIVYVVAVLEVSSAQLFVPAQGSLLPTIVRHEGDLLAANSVLSTSMSVTKLAGPPLGGLLFASLGLAGSALVDSTSFLLSAVVILAIRPAARSGARASTGVPTGRGFLNELIEGVRFITGQPTVRALCLTIGIIMITQGLLETVLVPFVRGVLHFGPVQFGLIAAAQGLGSVLSAIAIGAIRRHLTSGVVVAVAMLLAGLFMAGFAFARPLWLSATFIFLFSMPNVVFVVWTTTYYQQRVEDRLLGRVLGAVENIAAAGILVGIVIASLTGGPFGPTAVLVMAAGVLLFSSVLATIALRDARTTPPVLVSSEPSAAVYGE